LDAGERKRIKNSSKSDIFGMNGSEFIGYGIITGFIIAALPGPIWLLCLKRALSEGRLTSLVFGLGITTADGIYGTVAAFGLTALTNQFLIHSDGLQIIGGIFFCLLGIRIMVAKPSVKNIQVTGKGLMSAYGSGFLLTISNPLTILLYAGTLAGLGAWIPGTGFENPVFLATGICLGSILWWILLSYGAGAVQTSITIRGMNWINKISGLFLLVCGILTCTQMIGI